MKVTLLKQLLIIYSYRSGNLKCLLRIDKVILGVEDDIIDKNIIVFQWVLI